MSTNQWRTDMMYTDKQRVSCAMVIASRIHKFQRRSDSEKTPFSHHFILAYHFATMCGIDDFDILAAICLHDTVEDISSYASGIGVPVEEALSELKSSIQCCCGDKVLSIVLEVTDDKGLSKADRKRKQITSASTKSREAKIVKMADRCSNLNDLYMGGCTWDDKRKREYVEHSKLLLEAYKDAHKGIASMMSSIISGIEVNFERGE